MAWGFVRGQKYNRRQDIHARFGGQQQGGIITPANHNVIFIMTGKRGAEYGYDDIHYDDGRIDYFGEGQVGEMQMVRGNLALAEHVANGKDLLWFEKAYPERSITYMGQYICAGWRRGQSKDRDDAKRSAIIFELHPIENVVEAAETIELPIGNMDELRRRAFEAASLSGVRGQSMRTIYQRSADVRAYVLARANGDCEGCSQPAPFMRRDGSPYLEPHHLRRASDGGPDHPRFVIALCPNCHTRTHHGEDGAIYNAALLKRMPQIEP
ncbi:HNH endonuclease [Georhizobium profundi]|uniref:HNH endonuclease n=1 Tax=Georhizobium profundi TaxID=2341112 RepID=A0A3Q8XPM8_9HYPH|nr:HNH endonuclease [Georhizobium profundi]AZN72270.1 HNH endonuclease [Georhizobium profundi]